MAAQPNVPTTTGQSRGCALFIRQAGRLANDPDKSSAHLSHIFDTSPTQNKQIHPVLSAPASTSSTIIETTFPLDCPVPLPSPSPPPSHQTHASVLIEDQQSSSSNKNNTDSDDGNVQLIGIHYRSESTVIHDECPPSEQYIETDFPLTENTTEQESKLFTNNTLAPSNSICCAMIEQIFDYLPNDDDSDDDDNTTNNNIHHRTPSNTQEDPSYNVDAFDNEENSDGADSVDMIDYDITTSTNHQNDSKFFYLFSSYYYYRCHFNRIFFELICSPI